MRRASSDSAIWEHSSKDCASDEFSGDISANGDDIQLWGLTDDETDTENTTPNRSVLPCYNHIDSDDEVSSIGQSPELLATAKQELNPTHDVQKHQDGDCIEEQEEEIVLRDDDIGVETNIESMPAAQKALQEQLEKMMFENARLARENSMLRKEAGITKTSGTASPTGKGILSRGPLIAESRFVSQQAASTCSHQQCVGTWSLPSNMTMSAQMACFVVPSVPNQQVATQMSAGAEIPATQGKKARARAARERRAVRGGSTGATLNSASGQQDVILPTPVKPQPEPREGELRTTVMLRNMPNNYSRVMLLTLLANEGFAGQFDFLYLPMDFKSRACLGYAFINLVDEDVATRFWKKFDGFCNWAIPSRKVSGVSWSSTRQGFEAHVDRYRNSPVLSQTVPDEFKPMVFSGGVRASFPPPTRRVRSPQLGLVSKH